jgi:hypothetical protein
LNELVELVDWLVCDCVSADLHNTRKKSVAEAKAGAAAQALIAKLTY